MATAIPPQPLPRLISAEEVIPNTKRILAEFCRVRNSVAKNVVPSTASFNNVVKPLIDVENRTQGELQAMTMMRYASPDRAAREASDEAVRLMGECDAEFTARKDLFSLIRAVKDRGESLDFEASKYLDKLIKDFSRCGHNVLDQDRIKSYLVRRNEIDGLRRQYNRNVREENGGIWFSIEELDGLSSQDVSRFEEGTNSDQKGMRLVHHRRANFESIMKYARNPQTRNRMYASDAHKLSENLSLFKEIIIKRDENARLLGYGSHASFRLENRVAKTPDWVNNFFSQLADVLLPQGEMEMQSLLEVKQKYLAENTDYPQEHPDTMPPWDFEFYSRIALEAFQFIPVPPEALHGSRWHEDVEAWSVWDGRSATEDFAEAPSVMPENWCWMKDELKRMSCHYTKLDPENLENWHQKHPGKQAPPEQIPEELLDSLVRSRKHNRALWYLRQLALSRFDMAVHHVPNHAECHSLDPGSIYNDLMEKFTFLTNSDSRDRGYPHTDFSHLFSGYDAGYYSYLAAHVFAADIFQTTFAGDPSSQVAWENYRCGILQYGGSRDELEMMEEFLGHPAVRLYPTAGQRHRHPAPPRLISPRIFTNAHSPLIHLAFSHPSGSPASSATWPSPFCDVISRTRFQPLSLPHPPLLANAPEPVPFAAMDPDSIAANDANVDVDVEVNSDVNSDDEEAMMAQAMGFASFGAQHPNKKRRYNPRADAAGFVPQSKPSATGANSTALGPAPTTRSNADEIALDDDDGDDVDISAPAQVRPASLPQRPAAPSGVFATGQQAPFQPRRPQDPPPQGPWYEGYYDPTTNENPWERLEKARGLSSVGPWLPRGSGPGRPSTTGAPA
ncbi:hypothetical protein G7Z17_g8250 [Cylindrodendrum hubeiense]|uniref:Peptidase M3A/M3B catalytic domain-containing protein n=1 Tax=Cylindrodendrum hubeiense TaxID=595255 RepID=A0A9P5L6P3_9HYPO|nr:hypothetical protein G7Z17_g8250 [Cylindrodendrum hubeiense]